MRKRLTATVLLTVLLIVASTTSTMWYANRVADQSESRARQESLRNELKWCSVVATIDRSYRESPPQTATGKNLAAAMRELRADLRCPPD